jgi:hypothetical protein
MRWPPKLSTASKCRCSIPSKGPPLASGVSNVRGRRCLRDPHAAHRERRCQRCPGSMDGGLQYPQMAMAHKRKKNDSNHVPAVVQTPLGLLWLCRRGLLCRNPKPVQPLNPAGRASSHLRIHIIIGCTTATEPAQSTTESQQYKRTHESERPCRRPVVRGACP